mmetsp:Transcript_12047/g.31033  ORF Transcript_12047/g.31033 Transcript_12047/m.31033 type:complete len:200 (+) Transcript_12047:444-1043(+)
MDRQSTVSPRAKVLSRSSNSRLGGQWCHGSRMAAAASAGQRAYEPSGRGLRSASTSSCSRVAAAARGRTSPTTSPAAEIGTTFITDAETVAACTLQFTTALPSTRRTNAHGVRVPALGAVAVAALNSSSTFKPQPPQRLPHSPLRPPPRPLPGATTRPTSLDGSAYSNSRTECSYRRCLLYRRNSWPPQAHRAALCCRR